MKILQLMNIPNNSITKHVIGYYFSLLELVEGREYLTEKSLIFSIVEADHHKLELYQQSADFRGKKIPSMFLFRALEDSLTKSDDLDSQKSQKAIQLLKKLDYEFIDELSSLALFKKYDESDNKFYFRECLVRLTILVEIFDAKRSKKTNLTILAGIQILMQKMFESYKKKLLAVFLKLESKIVEVIFS